MTRRSVRFPCSLRLLGDFQNDDVITHVGYFRAEVRDVWGGVKGPPAFVDDDAKDGTVLGEAAKLFDVARRPRPHGRVGSEAEATEGFRDCPADPARPLDGLLARGHRFFFSVGHVTSFPPSASFLTRVV